VVRCVPVEEGGVMLEKWESFKSFLKGQIKKNQISDVLFRHLYC